MKKHLLPLFAMMASFVVFGCSDTKTPATEKTAEPAKTATEPAENAAPAEAANVVQVAKTIKLANGASVTWIQDNQGEKLNPRSLFSDASDSLFASLNLPDGIPASVSVFLLQVDGKNILFDAGLGAFGGQMLDRLAALDVTPDKIDLIYLTHFHVDHIAGMIAKDSAGKDVKVFNNATVYAGKVEYDAWMNDIPKNDLQKVVMGMYKDKLHLFAFGDSLPHGVLALDAVGHTPGHTAFQISNLLVIGDLMHGYALQKDHPEINSNYDMDKEKSIESRKRIMQYARDNKLTMAGMHLPPPGFAE
ncbi:MBL fold metallo-hydrolase [Fibrobacter sp. UWB5]|uniref:MBL fold metallo-hydrolase n=1 Tax=Fibrobacter sp. UWB5 TaxID=1964360 RepID=UPI000B5257E7|nr:MBL fold metallo-hydrolase [Fibrobacter sp. UWB5]OWV14118.1 MBL fold metallo-hydrolase [Fibrobacter sp. UWB5]